VSQSASSRACHLVFISLHGRHRSIPRLRRARWGTVPSDCTVGCYSPPRCLHPRRLWRLTLLRHRIYCSGYVLLVASALTTGGGACLLAVVRICTVGAGNANPCCASAVWFGRSAAADFPSSTATIVRDAQNACTGSYVQVASVVMRSELWLTLV